MLTFMKDRSTGMRAPESPRRDGGKMAYVTRLAALDADGYCKSGYYSFGALKRT